MEDEEDRQGQEEGGDAVVPFEFFAEVGHGKNRKYSKRDDFLDGFELRGVEFVGADAVGRDRKAVCEEGNAPTGDDDFPERFATVLEVPVPGKGHKDVGDGKAEPWCA